MHFPTIILTTLSLALTTLAAPTPASSTAPTCGIVNLEGGKTQTIYRDACYNIEGKVVSAQVSSACDCNFSAWEWCDAGKKLMFKRDVTGVEATQAKAYWCSAH